ncbi:hypothetical protein GH5_01919 [Leishmania sp. Ghana 2012 LV757]|uniref:hypothetical protein n=1 Tax=Leishmania sp. Ghana 2012 LV757 TaxID=2803181 RepID=UPI001B6C5A4B|nr:hypothetical protein GH5_01919 [Leishmania sp. Ghana 2012 LV757]
MYTSEPLQKKLRAKAPSASTARPASPSSGPFSTLPLLRRAGGTSTIAPPPPRQRASLEYSPRDPRSLPQSPIPPQAPFTLSALDNGSRTPNVVMDPLAALRHCLQYVCSHPEVYGDDVRGLLDREVMHVVRLKASEVSLTNAQRPLLIDALRSATVRQAACSLTGAPALPAIPAQSAAISGSVRGGGFNMDLFGYGSVSFLPASSVGFRALLQEGKGGWTQADQTGGSLHTDGGVTYFGEAPPMSSSAAVLAPPLDESIQWGGTLPPSCTGPSVLGIRSFVRDFAIDDDVEKGSTVLAEIGVGAGVGHLGKTRRASQSFSRGGAVEAHEMADSDDQSLLPDPHEVTSNSVPAAQPGAFCAADGSVVLIDQQGYEVTYLRAQLQQLEAAFNAKCVRLHELEAENERFAEKIKMSEEARVRWAAQHHAMKGQLEVMRRELDGWKDRATDAVAAATKQSKQHNQNAKQLVHTQLSDAKQEISRLGQLWRETERALQESRRVFENTEKESIAAHDHLTDVFHYLERLERRIARRDAYVTLCERRQRSLEEKYEKLRWGYEELSTLEGRYSYADYLLTVRPLWSVYMFVRLARHVGDYVALENPVEVQQRLILMRGQSAEVLEVAPEAAAAALADMEPLYGLLFSRSPMGGRLIAQQYDFHLIFRTMVDEATAELSRRGRSKQLRTNLHGSVACRVIRWHERYIIDYLRGDDSNPDSAELHRKFVPLLTLASLLLPLRSRTGTLLMQPRTGEAVDPSAEEAGSMTAEAASPEEKRVEALLSAIPNKRHYDEATIRFMLRCFWKERLAAFSQQMNVRLSAVNAKRARFRELKRSLRRAGLSAADKDSDLTDADEDEEDEDEEDEEVVVIQTFLASLVDFTARFTAQQAGSAMAEPSDSKAPPSKAELLTVRGVLTSGASSGKLGGKSATSISSFESKAASDSVWDCGRIFFAVVLQPDRTTEGKEDSTSPTNDMATRKEVDILAEEVREMLAALYYYTLEYKDLDPDFRLFHLVAHQLIPEMVAVNFFAGLEAFQLECAALLEWRLRCLPSGMHSTATRAAVGQLPIPPTVPGEVEDPLMALTRAVDIVDGALLDGEEEDIEPDSEGDGYGSILPFHAKAETQLRPSETASASVEPLQEGEKEDGPAEEMLTPAQPESQRAHELRLLHNVREYLSKRKEATQAKQTKGLSSPPAKVENNPSESDRATENPSGTCSGTFPFGKGPPEWTAVEEKVANSLGPHTALLDTFRRHCRKQNENGERAIRKVVKPAKELDYLRRRRAERKRRYETTKHLSATRGLLAVEDVLTLLQRHCLATYAVSCCGTPRFSLMRSLFGRSNDSSPDAPSGLDPYAIVGHLPLTGLHLQRLRFALSLDQPSLLIRPADLFAVDPITKSNSQFYDAYLSVVLDVFEQQQSFLMHSVLRTCVARHESYAAEGAEDCDGLIPISWLKKGLTAAFSTIRGTPRHAQAMLNHFVQYDELLRLEEDVKFEQFTDAPLLLNVPPSSENPFPMADNDPGLGPQSVTNMLADAEDTGNWNLREEADSCSLLNIAFAVRMSYIVWGKVSARTAEELVHRAVKHPVPVCCCDTAAGDAGAAMSAGPVSTDATVVAEFAEWDLFDQMTRCQYTQTLSRLQNGHNGKANPLRRMLSVLQAELLPALLMRSGWGTAAANLYASSRIIDADALYPDVTNVWITKKVLAEGQKRMEASAAALAAKGSGASRKGKKNRRSFPSRRCVVADQTGANDDDALREEEQVPDYGLLSLVRALGFAPSSSTGVLRPGGVTAKSKRGGGKKGTQRNGIAKSSAGPEASLPAFLQERYIDNLTVPLQDLAARVAALTAPDSCSSPRDVSDAADVSGSLKGATPSADNVSFLNGAAATPAPDSVLSRPRSVSGARRSRQSSADNKFHRKVTIEVPVDEAANSVPEPDTLAPSWVPVFPDFSEVLREVSPSVPVGTSIDVSKLYAICAALSMV